MPQGLAGGEVSVATARALNVGRRGRWKDAWSVGRLSIIILETWYRGMGISVIHDFHARMRDSGPRPSNTTHPTPFRGHRHRS